MAEDVFGEIAVRAIYQLNLHIPSTLRGDMNLYGNRHPRAAGMTTNKYR